jgi:hypothetical protein
LVLENMDKKLSNIGNQISNIDYKLQNMQGIGINVNKIQKMNFNDIKKMNVVNSMDSEIN